MMFLLVDDIIDNTLFFRLSIGKCTIPTFPFNKIWKTILPRFHEIMGGYFEIMNKRSHCYILYTYLVVTRRSFGRCSY